MLISESSFVLCFFLSGETATVLCDVDARPNLVTFYWSFNNSQNAALQYISEGLRSSLSFTPQSRDDFGNLACWGRNAAGNQQTPCLYKIVPAGETDAAITDYYIRS